LSCTNNKENTMMQRHLLLARLWPISLQRGSILLALSLGLAACGGGGGGASPSGSGAATSGVAVPVEATNTPAPASPTNPAVGLPATGQNALGTNPPAPSPAPSARDAARFLTQASFGLTGEAQLQALVAQGYERWLWDQFQTPAASHLDYLQSQKPRETNKDYPQGRVSEEMSYEAMWRQWLDGQDQLRGRMSWAMLQIFVISNTAPDLRPLAMSSYMDMLNRNAFGNFRQLLEDVTLHPAMGYYLNMLESEKEDLKAGTSPNENYAREVLQLFSIGLYQLNPDGTRKLDAGKPIATYGEPEIKGFARAFSGWSYGSLDNKNNKLFHDHDEDDDANWVVPLKAWASFHSTGEKLLLNGQKLAAGGTPEQDMKAALDAIFNHPNVPPFISRQLIQRLVTSNPSAAYVQRVAEVFVNNGSGVRGDLKAVARAILLDAEARDVSKSTEPAFGKQREPVIRMANLLRATAAKSQDGTNRIHYLDSADEGLGQSPLLAPSVFNFYSPFYSPPGEAARRSLVAPEFQITTEISVVGSLNFFSRLINNQGYGNDTSKVKMDYASWEAVAANRDALLDKASNLLFAGGMTSTTRATMAKAVDRIDVKDKTRRVKAVFMLTAVAPDFVIQK
jgi:uncharacterized protein (DUF1800 family)